jgi:hypothetical protein
MTIGAFATDGDSGYDTIHKAESILNMIAFTRNQGTSMAQHFRGLSDILHLPKRAVPTVEENYNGDGFRNRHDPTEPRKVYWSDKW